MADILREIVGIFDKRYRDMGDGTHAEVVSVGGLEQPLTRDELAAMIVNVMLNEGAAEVGTVFAKLIDEAGDAYGVKHIDNKIRTTSKPYLYDIAEGHIASHSPFRRFGHNPTVGTSYETLWEYSTLYTYTATAAAMYISSANDTDAQSYQVVGLDADWNYQTQLVTAAGQTKTEIGSGLTWMRIFKVKNMGTTNNAGAVYVYEDDALTDGVPDTAGKVRSMMSIGENESHMGMMTIPADKKGFIVSIYGGEVEAKSTDVTLWIRPFGGVFQFKRGWPLKAGSFSHAPLLPYLVPAKADIEMRVKTGVGAGNTQGSLAGWYEDA